MAIAFVNRTEGFSTSVGSSSQAAAAASHTAGNLVWAWLYTQTNLTATLADTAGNTYPQIGSAFAPTVGFFSMFYAKNIIGNASNIVTATFSTPTIGGSTYVALGVRQFSGCDTTSPLVGTLQTGSGTGTAIASGTVTVSGQSVICAGIEGNPTLVAGSGYSLTPMTDGFGGFTGDEYHITSANEAATATAGSAGLYGIIAVAFKAAALSGKPPQGLFRSMAR